MAYAKNIQYDDNIGRVESATRGGETARSLAFYESELVQLLFWARMPGDALIILGTVLFGYDATKKVLARRETTAVDETPDDAPIAEVVPESDD